MSSNNNNKKQAYLNSKINSWSYATYKAEASRLASIPEELLEEPAKLYQHFVAQGYKPYTIKTLFVRASQLAEFHGCLKVKRFMRDNARLFKYTYQPKKPVLTFEQAREAIAKIADATVRGAALGLLTSGLRISEAQQCSRAQGTVVGKGGASRTTVASQPLAKEMVRKLRKELLTFDLTPHMLRKLAATRVAELGGREADLLAIFGWRSAQVASYYVQSTRSAELLTRLNEEAGT